MIASDFLRRFFRGPTQPREQIGNSGGPLINAKGEVIGINSAILERSQGDIGIGFAVPISTVKTLPPKLRTGKVPRGRLGIQTRTQPLTDEEAYESGLQTEGAVAVMVERDSPADRAGIRAGDVIVSYNGQSVRDGISSRRCFPGHRRERGCRSRSISIVARKESTSRSRCCGSMTMRDRRAQMLAAGYRLGLSLDDVTSDVARDLRLRPGADGAITAHQTPA